MERLTYDFVIGDRHCWQVKGADNLLCDEVCKAQGDNGCVKCPIAKAFDRLAVFEDFMERWKLTSIEEADCILQRVNALGGTDLMAQYRNLGPIARLSELVQAEKEGRLSILPKEEL